MQDIYMIVGLGNPGNEYTNTRHNAGFMTLDKWCQQHAASMTQNKFQGIYGSMRLGGKLIHLLKPQTFMNLSGQCVAEILSWYKLGFSADQGNTFPISSLLTDISTSA